MHYQQKRNFRSGSESACASLIILIILFLYPSLTGAESSDRYPEESGTTIHTDEQRLSKAYVRDVLSHTKEIATSPAGWEKKTWMKASVVLGVTAGLYAADQEIQEWMQDSRNSTTEDISEFFEHFGNGMYTLPPIALLYAYGHYYDIEKPRKVALMCFESFFITGIFTQAGKFSFHRHRPNSGNSYDTWDGPGFETENLSFPSGHSSSVFSLATILANEYDDNALVPVLAYGTATLTALSRVHDNKHWASDVFAGSALGYFTAKAVIELHSEKNTKRVSIHPVMNADRTAIMASYSF